MIRDRRINLVTSLRNPQHREGTHGVSIKFYLANADDKNRDF